VETIFNVYRKHTVHFQWIKGHNQHPQNERCDQLAVQAAKGKNLIPDTFFEQIEKQNLRHRPLLIFVFDKCFK